MGYPNIPARSRSSGEKTVLQFVPLLNYISGAIVEGAEDDGSGRIKFTGHAEAGSNFGPVAGNTVIVIGTDMKEFNGYHVVESLAVGEMIVRTEWPSNVTSPVDFTSLDHPHTYDLSDLHTTGQATDTSGGSSSTKETVSAIGHEDFEDITDVQYDCSISAYVDDDVLVGKLLGSTGDLVAGVYKSEPVIELDFTAPAHAHVFLTTFTGRSKFDAEILFTTVYESVLWDGWDTSNSAGKSSFSTWDLSGQAERKYVIKQREEFIPPPPLAKKAKVKKEDTTEEK
jgi:hypothetical protein